VVLAATEREGDLRAAVEEIRELLRQRHRLGAHQLDNFTIRTQADIAEVQGETSQTLMVMLLVIASVSLLVGGIGIMNILLVSVTQRTREIGVRMAVGATRFHILAQFLSEAVVLSLAGSILGVFVGITGARLVTAAAGWPTVISIDAVVIAVVLSMGVGLFFGLYPAHKAARLKPIEALRYE
jgi:putative ABC transport system permease protein